MKLYYILRLADDALILGHRLGEWCGHGPILEQDIALSNTALDLLGRARSLYQYAAEIYNQMPEADQQAAFASIALQQLKLTNTPASEDSMAYLRDSWDFKNVLLVEHPNLDWAYTIARSFYNDAFYYFYFSKLISSTDTTIAAIAEKSLKEVTYHLRWSSEWVIRLGDGTAESHQKMQQAVDSLWMYTGELFLPTDYEAHMHAGGVSPDLGEIKELWEEKIAAVLEEATLTHPTGTWMQQGGKEGRHTEHLGYILAELQYMQRVYPNMEW